MDNARGGVMLIRENSRKDKSVIHSFNFAFALAGCLPLPQHTLLKP